MFVFLHCLQARRCCRVFLRGQTNARCLAHDVTAKRQVHVPQTRCELGFGGADCFFDMSFVCRNHVLGASLRAQAPFLTCVVWQMRTKRAPCRARGMKGGDGFKAANEAAMAAEAAHACAHHRTTSFGALRGRAGGLIAPERVPSRGENVGSR